MSNEISINIKIANRNYKIKVAADHEEIVRDSLHKITEKMNTFHKNFPGRDDQDYMAMTLIDYITADNNVLSKKENKYDETVEKELKKINDLLDL